MMVAVALGAAAGRTTAAAGVRSPLAATIGTGMGATAAEVAVAPSTE
jgi:hypothetical protein